MNLRLRAQDRGLPASPRDSEMRTPELPLSPRVLIQHLRARSSSASPRGRGPLSVRRLTHPEDGSVTWFVGSPNIHVVDDANCLDALLNGLEASRAELRFDPPELRSDFEREFGLCCPPG